MEKFSHTPGPWVIEYDNDVGPDDEGFWEWFNVGPAKCDRIEDATLIAAAPELLEALRYARRFLRSEDHDTAFVDAAIAKAMGDGFAMIYSRRSHGREIR